MYEPMAHGARCDLCALRLERGLANPVGPEDHGAAITFVGEAPHSREVAHGRPFIGPTGKVLQQAREELGLGRADFNYTYALACQPPKNKLDRVLAKVRTRNQKIGRKNAALKEQNKDRKKAGSPLLPLLDREPTPVECCRPRLMKELGRSEAVITLGKVAITALNPDHRRGIRKTRGMPMSFTRDDGRWTPSPTGLIKVLPTLSPGFVSQTRRWYSTFVEDLRRGLKLFSGEWSRVEPIGLINPSIKEVAEFLGVGHNGTSWVVTNPRPMAFDYETDLLETLDCVVRCIQIGTVGEVLLLAFKSVEGASLPYSPDDHEVLKDILRAWFMGPGLKIGHNSNSYDALVTEAFLGCGIRNHADNIMAHRLIEGELPHSLLYLGSRYSLIHDWKAGDPGVNARTDASLWWYGILDSSVTAEVAPPIYSEVERRGLGSFASSLEYSSRLVNEHVGRFSPGIGTPTTPEDLKTLEGCPVFHEGLTGLLAMDHSIQDAGRDMHVVGMLPIQPMRVDLLNTAAETLNTAADKLRKVAHEVSGTERWGGTARKPTPFNPASPMQIRRLLHDEWGLTWDVTTAKTGMLSTGDSAVRKILSSDRLPTEIRSFLLNLRAYRKAHKIVTTYLIPLGLPLEGEKPRPTPGWGRAWSGDDGIIERDVRAEVYNWAELEDGEELEELDLETAQNSFYAPKGRSKLRWNGRLHASWLAHRAVTGRISSSPNCQNIPRWLRKMFVPSSQEWLQHILPGMRNHPGEVGAWAARGVDLHREHPREGHTFVYADADQIELRIAAARWGAARYLEAFEQGLDPHQITMHAIWGDRIWSMQGAPPTKADRYFKTFADGSEFDKARDLGKAVLYASVYGAKPPTVHDIISSAENKQGKLLYPDLTIREVKVMQANLLKNCPEFREGWKSEIKTLKDKGFIFEPVGGRQFDCLDGSDDLSLIVNRPIQGSAATIIALATADMRSQYPAGFGGVYTGLANHCHDAMTWEVPISMAPKLRDDLTMAMCRSVPAYPEVKFIGEAIITPTWK